MIRKQLYIEKAQDKALKRRARELGVSEAEVMRRALDGMLHGTPVAKATAKRMKILHELFEENDSIAETYRFPEGYQFNRQELYEEDGRFTRWDRE